MSGIVAPKFIPIADIYATKTKRGFLSYKYLYDIHLPDGTILKQSVFDVQGLIDEYGWMHLLESIVVQLDDSAMYRLIYASCSMQSYIPNRGNNSGSNYTMILIHAICHIKYSTTRMLCEAKLILARLLGCHEVKHPGMNCSANDYPCYKHINIVSPHSHRLSKNNILTESLQTIEKSYIRSAQHCQQYIEQYQQVLEKCWKKKIYAQDAREFCKQFVNFDDDDVAFLINGVLSDRPIVTKLIDGSIDMRCIPNYRHKDIKRVQERCIRITDDMCSHRWAKNKGYNIPSRGCAHLEEETLDRLLSDALQPPSAPPLSTPTVSPDPKLCDTNTPQDMICVVCQSTPKCTLFLPCRHLCTCVVCSENLKQCPMCRSHIASQIKVYI